jgi:hypothetical protein
MNLQIFTPFLVGLTLAGIRLLAKRDHHETVEGNDVYKYSSGLGYLLMVFGLIFAAIPLLPIPKGNASAFSYLGFFWLFSLVMFASAIYILKYRLTMHANYFSDGAFTQRTIQFRDIASTTVQRGASISGLYITLSSGKKIRFSGMLGDFETLVDRMTRCAEANQNGGGMPSV